jgi:membrane-associated phospholipid phosphatase
MSWQTANLKPRIKGIAWLWAAILIAGFACVVWTGDSRISWQVSHSPWVLSHEWIITEISEYGMYPFYVFFLALLGLGWQWQRRDWRIIAWAYIIAQLAGATFLVRILKITVGHGRPGAGLGADHWIGPTLNAAFHSFPSGHTADLFTSAIFVAMLCPYWWLRLLSFGCAITVALTRIALTAHYPTDLLAGALVGGGVSLLVAYYWILPRLH